MLKLLIIFPIKVDLIGELRWRTLEFEFSCGTTVQAFSEETSHGPFLPNYNVQYTINIQAVQAFAEETSDGPFFDEF